MCLSSYPSWRILPDGGATWYSDTSLKMQGGAGLVQQSAPICTLALDTESHLPALQTRQGSLQSTQLSRHRQCLVEAFFSHYKVARPDTVKPVLSGHLKIDKTKILMENGSLMKVESIAECSPSAILLTCIKR